MMQSNFDPEYVRDSSVRTSNTANSSVNVSMNSQRGHLSSSKNLKKPFGGKAADQANQKSTKSNKKKQNFS
jgi:hypothetical protein